jgi:serine/threonine protein kinase
MGEFPRGLCMLNQDFIGQQLGNYRLKALLGKGGFARVYLGEHIFLGPQAKAAIKVLNETTLSDEDRQNFTTEAKTIRKLNHPHVVKLLEFGIKVSEHVDASIPYLVMDYAPEGTLRNRHPLKTAVPIKRVVSYIDQVADGLQYAHDQGVVHSDLKPENMLVMGVDDIVLSDFGIAIANYDSQNHKLANDGGVQGTLVYIAPERFRGATRRASDQYSLGIVVYEWLTGTHPFKGANEQIIYHHLNTSPPRLYGVYPNISQEVEAVVMRALAKEPEQRFPSVKDFAQALSHAAQSAVQVVMQAGQDYAEISEQKVTPAYPSGSTLSMDNVIDLEAVTEKTGPKVVRGKQAQVPDEAGYETREQIDSDEQVQHTNTDKLQPDKTEQQVNASEQPAASAEAES